MKLVTSLGLVNVTFEQDAKVVADRLKSTKVDNFESGAILKECSSLLSSFPQFKIEFVRR